MTIPEELKLKIMTRLLYHITSKKFWAWMGANILRVVGKIDIAAWTIVTGLYVGAEVGQNIAETVGNKLGIKIRKPKIPDPTTTDGHTHDPGGDP